MKESYQLNNGYHVLSTSIELKLLNLMIPNKGHIFKVKHISIQIFISIQANIWRYIYIEFIGTTWIRL